MNLDTLQAKTKTWHSKLAAINFFLGSEFLLFTIVQVLLDFFHLPLLFANFLFLLAETFPEANMFAIRAMKKVRAEAGAPADSEVSMEELLAAVSEWVKTLRSCSVDLLKAAIHVFRMLWPY